MKREVLRIIDLNYPYTQARSLEWINLTLFEGERTGFLGLSYSGKDALIRILTGQTQTEVSDLHISIDGERVSSLSALQSKIYHIGPGNYHIGEWTAAEYIGLKKSGWLQLGRQKREMLEKVGGLLDRLQLSLNANRKLKRLTELEKRLMDLAKACMQGARVIVIEDEFEGMTQEEIDDFSAALKRITAQERLTVIISTHSDLVLWALSEQYIFFRNGKIVKKCRCEAIRDQDQLEDYLLGTMITTKKSLEAYAQERRESRADDRITVFRARSVPLGENRVFELSFLRGSVTTILVLGEAERMRLFLNLSGRKMDAGAYCIIDDRRLTPGEYRRFVEQKVVSIMHLGSREEVFDNMSVEENLLLPSLRKISSADYIFSSDQLIRAVDRESTSVHAFEGSLSELDTNDSIAVVLERWYLYNPKVLILLEPFDHCDVYGVSIVRSYIRRFASRGTAVVILKCREEYVEDISDEMVSLY